MNRQCTMFKQFYAECNQRFTDWKSDPKNYAKNNVYIAASGKEKSFFYKDNQHEYMPEFFLGDPSCCSAVILNLNPGTADSGFHYKDQRFNNYNWSNYWSSSCSRYIWYPSKSTISCFARISISRSNTINL